MKKSFWKSGVGELLGFAIVAPFLFAFLFMTISIYQVTVAEEQMIYATYLCGREAVMQPNLESAKIAGKKKLDSLYSPDGSPFLDNSKAGGYAIMGFRVLAGNPEFDIDASVGADTVAWLKGNVIVVSISQEIRPLLSFMSGTRVRGLGMMIEHSQLKIENSVIKE